MVLLRSRLLSLTLIAALVCGILEGASAQFQAGISQGVLHSKEITEASGLVASVAFPGFLWTHNDSGDLARIFLIDQQARHRATFFLEGLEAVDWEDIGRMNHNGRDYLIVGDIGDNRARREFVSVHVFPEPEIPAVLALTGDSPVDDAVYTDTIRADQIQTFKLRYEDGPRDAEALFFDAQDRRLYILSKRELQVGLYGVNLPLDTGSGSPVSVPASTTAPIFLLKREANFPHTFITAADLSPDGSEVLIKNIQQVFYWKRQPGESIPQLFSRPGLEQIYRPEIQGEAVAFAADGKAYYTLSEQVFGLPVHLYYYKR